MNICIFGAGAVGGYLGARLLGAGQHTVSIVARGAHGGAIASNGLTLIDAGHHMTVRPHAVTDKAGDLPVQDVVFVTLKAHALPTAAQDIGALLGRNGVAVFANNGIPWWWKYKSAADPGGPLSLLDPDGSLWTQVRPQRSIGCVVYSANEVVRPGVVQHVANNRWLLGEPDGSMPDRLLAIVDAMRSAGLWAEAVNDLRDRIWDKLLRNAPLNSICALTRLSVGDLGGDARLIALSHSVIEEIARVAADHGCDLSDRVEVARAAIGLGGAMDGAVHGRVLPSMLQDVLAGRRMEVQSILGQVQAFARETRTPSPVLDVLVALVCGLDLAAQEVPV